MKALQVGHLMLTVSLLAGVAAFGVLLLMGVIEVRRPHPPASPPAAVEGVKARLLVVRGLRPNWEYPIFEGKTFLGRADEQPVEIDLQPQEPEDRIWSSRQHAAVTWDCGIMTIEDLNSANGTYVNRSRVPPGERRELREGDVIQVGEVQLKVVK